MAPQVKLQIIGACLYKADISMGIGPNLSRLSMGQFSDRLHSDRCNSWALLILGVAYLTNRFIL